LMDQEEEMAALTAWEEIASLCSCMHTATRKRSAAAIIDDVWKWCHTAENG
jgi:hypothetical protein